MYRNMHNMHMHISHNKDATEACMCPCAIHGIGKADSLDMFNTLFTAIPTQQTIFDS